MPILTSPFPTAHDTIGPSTLSSPRQIPSSPPSPQSRPRSPQNGPSDAPGVNNQLTAKSSSEASALDLDKRLSEYMVNWNKFPGASKDAAVDVFEDDEENHDLEVGGPEDFTMNLDKYLEETTFRNEGVRDRNENGLNQEEPEEREDEDDHDDNEDDDDDEERVLPEYSPSPSPRPRHRHNPVETEESEFGPPVDISTPSHLMWRRNYSSGKEETRLENIEESLNGSPAKTESPAKSDRSNGMEESRTFTTVLREIEDLHEQRRERDEKIRENEKRIASSRVEIDRLRAELQRKDDLLSEANGRLEEQELLRQQLKLMEKQVGEQASGNEKHAAQIQSLQDELEKAHQHIKSRDEALGESSAKLRDLTAVNEMLARQKDTEIDDLKGQINEKELQIIDADEELAEVQRQYDILKDRIESLEARSIPLKEKTLSLESQLAQSKDEHASLKQSLINITADLPIDIEGKNCSEIINLLHQHIKDTKKRPHLDHEEQETQQREKELQDKLDRIESALRQSVADKEVAATELERSKNLLAETRKLVITVEEENTRLTTRTQELGLSLNQTREDMENLKEQHRRELASLHNTIGSEATRLHDSSIDKTHQALKEAHRLEIQNLREINSSATNELRASYNGTIQHLRNMHSKAERRATDLQNQLLDMQSTTNAQSREIHDLRSEIQQLQNTLSLKEEAAADLDKVIAKSIEKREREWERRMELVLRERDQMGKALMWTWGEIEVGKTSAENSKNKRHHEAGSATANANDTGNANANAATTTTVARPVSGERAVAGQPRQGYKYKYIVRS